MADAMNRLRAELAEARAIYDDRDKTPDGEAGAQAGVVNTIDAVVRFLVRQRRPPPAISNRYFMSWLHSAITAAARGTLYSQSRKDGDVPSHIPRMPLGRPMLPPRSRCW